MLNENRGTGQDLGCTLQDPCGAGYVLDGYVQRMSLFRAAFSLLVECNVSRHGVKRQTQSSLNVMVRNHEEKRLLFASLVFTNRKPKCVPRKCKCNE